MEFKKLDTNPTIEQDKKLQEKHVFFEKLLEELKKKEIPVAIVHSINKDLDEINSFSGAGVGLLKLFRKKQTKIIKMLEKEIKLVTKNHYRNRWMAVGMSAIGIPIGVAIGISIGNLGILAIGLPIGMAMGMAIGTAMDKKAKETGKQLDVEMKY